jgi:hypothetical protein
MFFGATLASKETTQVHEKKLEKIKKIMFVLFKNATFSTDYSEVVTFDTTYRTNQYSMPLAMFVGFNNQMQNVVFGQALLRDEKADTFEWLFRQFQICVRGKDPIVIFTGVPPPLLI